jgi:hypothetical protein
LTDNPLKSNIWSPYPSYYLDNPPGRRLMNLPREAAR